MDIAGTQLTWAHLRGGEARNTLACLVDEKMDWRAAA